MHMKSQEVFLQFIDHLKETIKLSDLDVDFVLKKLEIKKLKRKEYLIQPGDVSRYMRFIVSGCMRSFYLDENSQEHTLQFGIENWWINDLHSYLSRQPSRMYVQSIEKTVLVQIHRDNLESLYLEVPEIARFFRLKIQSAYVALQERTIENLSTNSYERYSNFRTQFRDIEQRLPQYVIASYLGMRPEFLSALKKKHVLDFS